MDRGPGIEKEVIRKFRDNYFHCNLGVVEFQPLGYIYQKNLKEKIINFNFKLPPYDE